MCPSCSTLPVQREKENHTGMPDNLKAGVENLSGIDMSDVRVHYNSEKPAEVGALAYTQGMDIHVAPGQDRHLPHEAWHVVQQAQDRVKPMMQMKNGVTVNEDKELEQEADVLGARAVQMKGEMHDARYDPDNLEGNQPLIASLIHPHTLLQRFKVGYAPNNVWLANNVPATADYAGILPGNLDWADFDNPQLFIAANGVHYGATPHPHTVPHRAPVLKANSDESGTALESISPEVDHIVPIAIRGTNDPRNARVLSSFENRNALTSRPNAAQKDLIAL